MTYIASALPDMSSPYVPAGTGYLGGYTGPAYPNAEVVSGGDLRSERDEIDINEVPAIIWRKEYDTDHRGLYKQIQHLSDYMLARGPSIYQHNNPNQRASRLAYRGILDPKEYDTALNTYGAPGVAKIKDYALFHPSAQRVIDTKLTNPFEFSIRDVSPAAREKRINAVVDRMTERATRAVAVALTEKSQADGQPADFSFLKNPEVNPDADTESPTIEEKTLNALLRDSVLRYKTLDEMRLAIEDKFELNAQAGHVEVENDDVYAVRDDIEQVQWIAPGRIKTAEDCSAIGLADYMSIPDILTRYGHLFGSRAFAENLTETVKKIRGGGSLGYRPRVFQLQDGRGNLDLADYITESLALAGDGAQVWATTNWQQHFYPWDAQDPSVLYSSVPVTALRHRLYFRVIKYLPARVTLNGKKPSPAEWTAFLHRNYEQKLDVTYELLKDDETPKKGDLIQKIPIVQLWQATRIGHNILIDVGRCTHAPRDLRQPKKIFSPIVLQVSYKRSPVTLGLDFARIWNTLWNRIDELILLIGSDDVTWIDDAQMSPAEANTLRHSMRKVGFAFFTSTRLQDRSNPMAARHLTTTKLGNTDAKVQNIMALAGLIKVSYETMIGGQPQAGAYDSAQKVNLVAGQQNAILQEFFYEDTLFDNQLLQRVSEIQRTVLAKDDWADVQYVGRSGNRIATSVKLSKSLAQTQPLVSLENGPKLQAIRAEIKQMASQALPSGGAAGIRDYIKLLFADNPYEALEIFDTGLNALDEINAQNSQQQIQIAQQKAEADAQKVQIPVQVEQLRGQNKLQEIAAKQGGEREKEDFKGNLADTQEAWQRERQVQSSELEKDRQSFTNALPPEWTEDEE